MLKTIFFFAITLLLCSEVAFSNQSTFAQESSLLVKACPNSHPVTSSNVSSEKSLDNTTKTGNSENPKLTSVLHFRFAFKWGTKGTGDSQFIRPHDVAFDSLGSVYVSERENDNVQKFTHNGTFIKRWGSNGTGPGQFRIPYSIGIDSSDFIYVVDRENHRIQKFDSDGNFITQWGGTRGSGDNQFNRPERNAHAIYVADTGNNRILKFDKNFTLITKWGTKGTGDGQFIHPHAIDVDSKGNVYVGQLCVPGVQVFDSNGKFLRKWGVSGTGDGQSSIPQEHIAIDSHDRLYIVDAASNPRVQIFDLNGKFLGKIGTSGTGDGQLQKPEHVSIDPKGSVYVVDRGNARVQVFIPVNN